MKKLLVLMMFGMFLMSFVIAQNEVSQQTQIKENTDKSTQTIQTQKRVLTQTQIQKIIQAKNRIRVDTQKGECPEKCTCTGSVMKCELDGGREMTIMAGKSGNMILQVKGANMSTKVVLYKEGETVYGVFKNNQTRIIKFMPDQVREKIKERIKTQIHDEEIELNETGVYQVQAKKKARLFFVIPIKEKIRAQIDSETGEIIRIRNSWWGFLARDIKTSCKEVGGFCETNVGIVGEAPCIEEGYSVSQDIDCSGGYHCCVPEDIKE